MQKRELIDFYKKDVPAYASYDNLRKLCGIDGLKLSQRKIIYAAFKRCKNDWIKTDTMCAQTQIDTNYIHGAANLEIVIDGLAASYVGSNNFPLLTGNSGGFGCRISPRPSAGRYTRIKLSDISKLLFIESDEHILEKQFFEGQYIEPKHLLPVFPIIFLNGTEGLSTGFIQRIFPRNPDEVIEYIKKKLSGTVNPRISLLPWFKGHIGKVEINPETGIAESFGVIKKNNMNSYTITELPIGIDYQKYIEQLDKFCESGLIQNYTDNCDSKTDTILFEIKTTREFTREHESERKLYDALKLIKSLPETYCCIDESGRVKEFTSAKEILDMFIEMRIKYYDKRKEYLLSSLKHNMEILLSKYLFVKAIIDKTLKVSNRKKAEIEIDIAKIDKIIKIDNSYDYLLAIPIHQLTKEKMDDLKNKIQEYKDEYKNIKKLTASDMWLNDIVPLKKYMR